MARVKPSPTGALLARAKALQASGIDIISLGAGEPDFDTPEHIKQAAIDAISSGDTKYTAIDGSADLKRAIRDKFKRENGLEYGLESIVAGTGAKQSIFNVCLALLDKGDEVVIPAPYWVSYSDIVHLTEATPVSLFAGIEDDFKIRPEQLDAALNENSRLVMLNNPSNPTGACYSAEEFRALAEVLSKWPRVMIMSDEIYEHIHWGSAPFASFAAACPELSDRTVTVNGVSKAYAMTGWRIGYAGGPKWLMAAVRTIQSQSTSNPCSISQAAAVEALNGDQACVADMCAAYRERHDYLVPELNSIPGFSCRDGDGTFYAFPRVTDAIARLGLENDAELAEHLITECRVATVPGSAFGADGYLRLSFASSMETLEAAVSRIKASLVP